ncbi:TPA: restriction endonuclease subunit S, partial [Streptococcus suis]|nr:restriction endonuclease subunit S [Streptococcus suis]
MPRSDWNLVAESIAKFPSFPEQTAIGTFFSTLDRHITLHQRKLDTLKEQKKTYLKLLFPAKGQTKPALRFQGFEDDWEEVKLGEVVEKSGSGGTPKSTNKAYYGGNIPFLSITDITQSGKYITNTEKTLTEIGLENSSAWKVPKGAISLAMYASVGKLAILKTDVATSQAFFNMVFSNEIVRDYVYFILDKAQLFNEWLPLISTGTQGNLNAQKLK